MMKRAHLLSTVSLGAVAALAVGCIDVSNDTPSPTPTPTGSNSAPQFTSAMDVDVPENTSDSFYVASASDADGDAVSFSISGGADAAAFNLIPVDNAAGCDPCTAELAFVDAPDFENPTDDDGNNAYLVELDVSDGANADTLSLEVTVTDEAGGFSVERVGQGFDRPIFVADRGDGTGRLFIVEQRGDIEILDPATGLAESVPFLDISSDLGTENEQGLLGFALSPNFSGDNAFYINITNVDGDSEIRRYEASGDVADPLSEELVLEFDQPDVNHNGGWIGFGPDDYLYIASGDGGGANDPFDNGQDIETLLGAILRIDVLGAAGGQTYAIPPDNPFVGVAGADEIWAYGLRNPYRASFDSVTGFLYIGDVGQGQREEIDLGRPQDAGANYGWPDVEGTLPNNGSDDPNFTPPVLEYGRPGSGPDELTGRSVTGGVVYRGGAEDLVGQYIFADFAESNVWSVAVSNLEQGSTLNASSFTVRNDDFAPDAGSIANISSFGEDAEGEVYFTTLGGDVFRITPEP